jgi:predicted enzyme related to lactoylglutathione lyase
VREGGRRIDQESRSVGQPASNSVVGVDKGNGHSGDRLTHEEMKMTPTIRSLVIPVRDLDAAKAVYTALLGSPHTDESYYVGYNVNGFEIGLNPTGGGGGPVAFADVEDLDATRETLLATGASERDAPRQVAPGVRVCVLTDADGNPFGLRGT